MLDRLGGFVYRHPRSTLIATGVFLLVSLAQVLYGGQLTAGRIRGLESDLAERRIEEVRGFSDDNAIILIFSWADLRIDRATALAAIDRAFDGARRDPRVRAVITPSTAPPTMGTRMVNDQRREAYAVLAIAGDFEQARRTYPALRAAIDVDEMEVTATGRIPLLEGVDQTLERDLLRAELISLPLALLVLMFVFRTVVAAVLPVAVGGLAVLGGIAIILALSRVTEIASYTINVASLIGLGVAIDYSLFTISRYREELAAGASYHDALVRAMATAGRVVEFSGLAVGTSLAGLVIFRGSYLMTMGIGGAIVIALSVLFALTVLPALLVVLGPRINYGRLPTIRLWRHRGWLHRLSLRVTAHPWRVLLPTLGLLLALGVPFLFLRIGGIDARVLQRDAESRRGYEILRRDFPDQALTRLVVAVEFPTSPALTPRRLDALAELSRRIRALPAVVRVDSIVDALPVPREVLLHPPPPYAPYVQAAKQALVGDRTTLVYAITSEPPESDAARALVREIRQHRQVADGALVVGGQTAADVDSTQFITSRTPYVVAFVVAATLIVLFLMFGSVALPIKAVLMNVVSIAGSFGALVWAFQEGHLFPADARPIDPSVPILLFCILFGLSMDYEVLLLSRIREAYLRHGDNTRAVVDGLDHSAGLVTSAALIMVTVFGAFAFAEFVVIKEIGFGLALGVALDATLVRVLLVPSTMVLLGSWNWWAPPRIARWWRRWFASETGGA